MATKKKSYARRAGAKAQKAEAAQQYPIGKESKAPAKPHNDWINCGATKRVGTKHIGNKIVDIEAQLKDVLNIPSQAKIYLDGKSTRRNIIYRGGKLEFLKKANKHA
ncbi:MAG: hypothetical protein ABIH21_03430 [Patescibacteria group bacterium]